MLLTCIDSFFVNVKLSFKEHKVSGMRKKYVRESREILVKVWRLLAPVEL